ncbi:MAG: divalent metal cation transporter FieF [Zetaproteobacteria bacterium CG_4_9_14_3_um_filter_49_83]|nr:MAG: divalent metal cation transporter FieF [Zetaproteobacteria bacterium CG1_02_49_23]PIQ30142.1 MAG: divalent metal cation transporter FieF [Zetaproteobacteria bacterium CG17_big_fil_post_rev_8_21_14_2_50_50_13]PIV31562.1 MAG: divalent metal cation transporter FieF [Zetaproteobacteria bacterium CG02_land_8_20_14_3_00_50_9]PIY56057.1 MAG: divalent metal cation transporter FieF [Zetaproteobacteria bacterium CG_4_10_14_0_8_um_filter_49_80]PJA36412.1 MAG: divalent metal cation transporter FieF
MRLATYVSVSVAATLIVAKLIAWFMTDSISLLATLVDSVLDALAASINLFAVRHALLPADKQHRFGHGKAEALAGLGQATFIAGSSGFLILESFNRFINPQPLGAVGVGVGVMIFSIIATLGLLMVQRHVIEKTQSTAITADSLHYKTDLYVNSSVILALVLAAYGGWSGFDALFALGIGTYILFSAWEIIQHAMHDLMDHELSDDERQSIKAIVLSHPQSRGIHDLRTRRSGITAFIQLHLELDDELTLTQAHDISDEIEAMLLKNFASAEIIIHADPASLNEPLPEFLNPTESSAI